MKLKNVISILSLVVIIASLEGFITSVSPIIANQYIRYKAFRLIADILQKNWNHPFFVALGLFLALYVFWFLTVKKMKFDKDKAISLIIIILIVLLPIQRLVQLFSGHTFWSATKEFVAKIAALSAGIVSFNDILWLFKKHLISIIILIVGLIVMPLLLRFLTKVNWEKIARVIRKTPAGIIKVIVLIALVLIVSLMVLNLSIIIDRRINPPTGPNVILIMVDTLRADHLSSYGYFRKTSPNIDKLSLDSIFFKNAIVAAPWTIPSAGSLFTSRHPVVLGFVAKEPVKIDDVFNTLAEVFKENNYITKGIVSHTFISSKLGFGQGFDSYDETNAKGHGHISSPSITEKAISFIQEHRDDKFFLFLHYFDPHYDYILHKSYDYYSGYEGPIYSGQSIRSLRKQAPNMTANDIEYVKALYDSEISFTDEYIGKLLDKLRELGMYNETLIIFLADHGEEFLERGDFWIGHTKKLYQEQIHVPLIIKLPGGGEKKVVDEYVGLIDLMPTIVDYLGLKFLKEYQCAGEILNISATSEPKPRKIISDTRRRFVNLQSVIWKGWKLIYNQQEDTKELYDLKMDPRETKNLATENHKMLKETQEILRQWYKHTVLKKSEYKIKARQADFTEEEKQRLRSLGYLK